MVYFSIGDIPYSSYNHFVVIFSTRSPMHLYAMWPNRPNAQICYSSN